MNPTIIDITDRTELNTLLNQLTHETPALWGNLRAQSMIEHLVEAVEYTNGKRIAELHVSASEADSTKQLHVHSDFVLLREPKAIFPMLQKQKDTKTCEQPLIS